MTSESRFPVHLIRHGQTASYDSDAGLTELGRRQATTRARKLAEAVREGERIGVVHAPTERARLTAEVIRAELMTAASDARSLDIAPVRAEPGFANVTVRVDGRSWEPTQVRGLLERLALEQNPPGWVTEASRFWEADRAPGGAMKFWLTTPLLWHESPAAVVHRTLVTAGHYAAAHGAPDRVIVATHAGCLRALVAWAAGTDLGEPENAEEVTLVICGDNHASLTFRGQTWHSSFPSAHCCSSDH